jgi:peptidoglycan/LPS O-acetylase OafA/YrhL
MNNFSGYNDYMGMTSPTQTKVIFALYVVATIASVIIAVVKKTPLHSMGLIFIPLLTMFSMMFNASCLVRGGCTKTAWLFVLQTLVILGLMVMASALLKPPMPPTPPSDHPATLSPAMAHQMFPGYY